MTANILLVTVIFFPMAAAVAAYAIGKKNEYSRDIFAIAAVALNFVLCIILAMRFQGAELRLAAHDGLALHLRADGFRVFYGSVTAFLWLVTTLFSPEYFAGSKKRNRYWLFNLLTFGATMGVFFSADLRTTFLFFEIMTFTSYALVAHDEKTGTLRAADTFLAVSVICGLAVLMGMVMLQMRLGTLEFAELYRITAGMQDRSQLYLPGALLLAGFGGKAGMYPLHIWLPKAHPVAPAPASALLSGILTKTGIFGVAVTSFSLFFGDYTWGAMLLIPAAITMLLGAVLGVFSNDLKRTLACSSVSQIGFILIGIAMQTLLGGYCTLAARGTVLHMLNHSLFKLLLFVAAGIVYINRHELALDKIRGFGRGKPLFLFVFLMAALGITGFPFWSGYVSKLLLNESIYAGMYLYSGLPLGRPLRFLEMAFNFTGILTAAYMTKLFVALFIEKGEAAPQEKGSYISRPFAVVFAASALLLPVMGFFPALMESLAFLAQGAFYSHVPVYTVDYFSMTKLPGKLFSFAVGVAIYFAIIRPIMMRRRDAAGARVYANFWPQWLDLEPLVYRPVLSFTIFAAGSAVQTVNTLINAVINPVKAVRQISQTPFASKTFLVQRYYSMHKQLRQLWKDPSTIGDFSFSLLLIGTGICIWLVYVFTQAIR